MNDSKINMKKDYIKIVTAVMVMWLFWMFIYLNVPIGHDDWTWGSYIGIDRLETFLKDYNGRYLGSLMTVILTRTYIIRALIMSIITVGISVYMPKIVESNKAKRYSLFIVASLLMLLTPRNIFRQTYSWIAGFSNYVPPILLVLMYIFYIRDMFSRVRVPITNKLYIVVAFVLSLSTQLFIEHVTLYMIMLCVFVIGYSYFKFKKLYAFDISVFAGTIVGAIIMFSNGAYHKIAEEEDKYRTMATGLSGMIETALNQYTNIINKQFFMQLTLITVIIAILCVLICARNTAKYKTKLKGLSLVALLVVVAYPFYLIYKDYYTETVLISKAFNSAVEAIFSLVFYLALAWVIFTNLKENERRDRTLFLLGSGLALLAPLTVVTPIGGRNFLSSYIFFILVVLELIAYLINDEDFSTLVKVAASKKVFNAVGIIGCLMIMCQLILVFSSIGADGRYRDERIISQLEQGKDVIYVPAIKHEEYLQTGNPKFGKGYGGEYGFRAYFNIPKGTKVFMEDLNTEKNFVSYLDKVQDKDYMVIMSVKDEASSKFTDEMDHAMKQLGFMKSVKDKRRYSYIGVLNDGEVVYEECSKDRLATSLNVADTNVQIVSAGFEVGNTASILINNKEYAVNKRGINVVVYDKVQRRVVDSVAFDSYATGEGYR